VSAERDLWIFDDALPAPLFRQLVKGVRAIGDERLRNTYQTTFWFDLREQPSCIPEEAALMLRDRLPPGKRVVGVEWWLSRMRTTDVRVDFHQDRDEKLALRTGKLVHPRWSSVFFLNRTRGGLLAVTDALPNEENDSLAPDEVDFDLVAPRPNRFTVFGGSLTHGVLDANNQIPSKRLPGNPPLRLAVIFNWWHRQPEGVGPWKDGRIYGALGLPRSARPGRRTS